MLPDSEIQEAHAQLHSFSQLQASGLSRRGVERAVAGGALRRVGRGCYIDKTYWSQAKSETRHLLEMLAAVARFRNEHVFSRHSAAILHQLPLFRFRTEPLHTTVPHGPRLNSTERVVRHVAPLAMEDTVRIGPFLCTSLLRTAVDVARVSSPEVGIGCADEALRRVGQDMQAQRDWRRAALRMASAPTGARGNAAARTIIARADNSAESVAESVSRLYLEDLGFDVATQVPVRSPSGGTYWVDFELRGLGVFGEVDGAIKYTDPEMARGRSPEQIVIDEKAREDWIRGVTDFRMIRWGVSHLLSRSAFRDRLTSFRIAIPIRRPAVHPFSPSAPNTHSAQGVRSA